jgi:uncharacterized protein (DUF885 family)
MAMRFIAFIREQTTTSMDPKAIHELGVKEVERIEGQRLVIAKKLGFADLKSFRASLKNNPKLTPNFAAAAPGQLSPLRRSDGAPTSQGVRT